MLGKISDRIFFLEGEERSDRPFLYYINGDNISVAIDAGNSDRHVSKFYDELKKTGLREPSYTVITHWHWDHTFGMHAVAGKTIASVLTDKKLREVMNWRWTEQDMKHREESGEDISFCNECIKVEYPKLCQIKVVPADIIVMDRMALDLGGVSCILTHKDSPHSRDSLFAYIPEEHAFFAGDAGGSDFYDNNGKYDKEKLRAYINLVEGVDHEEHLIGHDYPQKKEEMLEYLKEELENIR